MGHADWEFVRVLWQAGDPARRRMLVGMAMLNLLLFAVLLFVWLAPWPQWVR